MSFTGECMGVYKKVGETNGEDQYQQLDSRGNGHALHFKHTTGTGTDHMQWVVEKPLSSNKPNGEMRKLINPAYHTSLFSLSEKWMFNESDGSLTVDTSCKVAKFSPFMYNPCHRITIKTLPCEGIRMYVELMMICSSQSILIRCLLGVQ